MMMPENVISTQKQRKWTDMYHILDELNNNEDFYHSSAAAAFSAASAASLSSSSLANLSC